MFTRGSFCLLGPWRRGASVALTLSAHSQPCAAVDRWFNHPSGGVRCMASRFHSSWDTYGFFTNSRDFTTEYWLRVCLKIGEAAHAFPYIYIDICVYIYRKTSLGAQLRLQTGFLVTPYELGPKTMDPNQGNLPISRILGV